MCGREHTLHRSKDSSFVWGREGLVCFTLKERKLKYKIEEEICGFFQEKSGPWKVTVPKKEEGSHALFPKTENTDNQEGIELGENHCSGVCE